ncbi:MAG TPA: nucleotide-binding protein [Terriglobia bacterium]|nr:nucleotide-binding protein [Terriglobia bacterium]
MATKRRTDAPQEEQPALLSVARSEARGKINTQIAKGRQILNQQLNTEADVGSFIGSYKKWSDFNEELLRFLFSGSDRILRDYRTHGLVGFQMGGGLAEDVRYYKALTGRAIEELESLEQRLELIPEIPSLTGPQESYKAPRAAAPSNANKVFIVHGHDSGLRETVARFVTQLSLEPVILHEKPNEGNTVIEKFEQHSQDVGFAIILLTPDDKGGAADGDLAAYQSRARQNVILELGYFLGALGRKKVCALYSHGVELPSDMNGVLYVPIDEADGWRLKLAKEIKASGIDIDLNKAI